ncbi:hypothetical protein [Microvirga flavescens]|uniref:hypothetical protein n=1 Tax=Microvirga flavescens TaxID=2249811 RepID=UPI0013001CB8|nr:hypothetical protein [Microvirga flavescens]
MGNASDLSQAVPWGLSFAGLIWNYINYRRTTGLQKQIRFDTVRLEEFRRVRTAIDTVLTELGSERDTLRSLSTSAVSLEELRPQVKARQDKIQEAYLRLESALKRADQSKYASGNDWAAKAEGYEDRFLDALDKAYNPNRREDQVRPVPAAAANILHEMICAIDQRLDAEMTSFIGEQKNSWFQSLRFSKQQSVQ